VRRREKTALPSCVSKHEPHASKKAKPQLASRQKKKVEEANYGLAPHFQSTKLLTVGETAWLLRLSKKTVRRMLKAGNLVIIHIGRSARIDPQVIEKIIC
jgi:excisionase family DNA binding protein